MELQHLRAFATVAECGTLTAAAARLHCSQPTVSAQIQTLEKHFGVSLFERQAQGVALTIQGARLLERARSILAGVEQADRLAAALRDGVPETLRLGIIDDGYGLMLQDIIGHYQRQYPDVRLQLRNGASGAKRAEVIAGELEVAIVEGPVLEEELVAWPLMEVTLQIAMTPALCAELAQAELVEVAGRPWVFSDPRCSYAALMSRLSEELGITLDRRFSTDSVQACLELVMAGHAISLCNRDRVAELLAQGSIALWPGFQARLPRSVIAHRDRAEEPAIRALIASCLAAFGKRAGRLVA